MLIELPAHLSGDEAVGLVVGEEIAQYELGGGRNFVYLILDWSKPAGQRSAAIVDPQSDLEGLLNDLAQHGFKLETILLTHTHYDHVAGVGPLLKRDPALTIRVGADDLHRLPEGIQKASGLKTLKNGEQLRVGSIDVTAHHTPGHSAGEFCFFLAPSFSSQVYLLTGDLIFIRDCGRTDFPDGSDAQMFDSIQRVKQFSPETILLVGHHYAKECATTLARELVSSPPFLCNTIEELAKL